MECPKCQRTIVGLKSKCIYCGAVVIKGEVQQARRVIFHDDGHSVETEKIEVLDLSGLTERRRKEVRSRIPEGGIECTAGGEIRREEYMAGELPDVRHAICWMRHPCRFFGTGHGEGSDGFGRLLLFLP